MRLSPEVEADASAALKLNEGNVKAQFRRAEARLALDKLPEALADAAAVVEYALAHRAREDIAPKNFSRLESILKT